MMQVPRSDAIVVFGVTGDLVHKEIFPALYGLFRDEGVSVPVIGVARSDWSMDQLVARARDAVEKNADFDEKVFARLAGMLRYVQGDYGAPETYEKMCRALQGTGSPLFYVGSALAVDARGELAPVRRSSRRASEPPLRKGGDE
jgi:glucose-6-phosphate 1-dehydrogenase